MTRNLKVPAIVLVVFVLGNVSAQRIFTLRPDTTVIHTVPDYFMSLGLDSSLVLKRWEQFDMTSQKLRTLTSALAPVLLRLGGTDADFLYFEELPRSSNDIDTKILYQPRFYKKKKHHNFVMTRQDVDTLMDFVSAVGYRLLFDLNVLVRRNNQWDPQNAVSLLAYMNERNFAHLVDWQLGNEPNSLRHQTGHVVSAKQLARDYLRMVDIVRHCRRCQGALTVGPDVTNVHRETEVDSDAKKYLMDFLSGVTAADIDGVTWHQYYLNGHTATLDDFKQYGNLRQLRDQIGVVRNATRSTGHGANQIWLGETGSAFGGGAPGLSDRFVAVFYWLDKLGLSAELGLSVIIRQSLYGGHYAMLDEDMNPRPDYWVSLLYRRLVGTAVLSASIHPAVAKVNVYSHCGIHGCERGVVMFGLSMRTDITVMEVTPPGDRSVKSVEFYGLTGADYSSNFGLLSSYCRLNFGRNLTLTDHSDLPAIQPLLLKRDPITQKWPAFVYPYSVFFININFHNT